MKHAPVRDLSGLPVILTLEEIAAVYRISSRSIRRALERKSFQPRPFDRSPYRWLRDDVIRDLQTRNGRAQHARTR